MLALEDEELEKALAEEQGGGGEGPSEAGPSEAGPSEAPDDGEEEELWRDGEEMPEGTSADGRPLWGCRKGSSARATRRIDNGGWRYTQKGSRAFAEWDRRAWEQWGCPQENTPLGEELQNWLISKDVPPRISRPARAEPARPRPRAAFAPARGTNKTDRLLPLPGQCCCTATPRDGPPTWTAPRST